VAVVPLPTASSEHRLNPNQLVVLWPYAAWTDDRLHLGERAATLTANPAPPFKIGFRSTTGSVGYLRDGVLFVLRFDAALGSARPDLGCNLEIYSDERTLELESLGRWSASVPATPQLTTNSGSCATWGRVPMPQE